MPTITAVHFVYLAITAGIIGLIAARKDTVLFTLVSLFIIGVLTTHSLVGGLKGIYNSIMNAATSMLNIPILIAVIYAMSRIMKETGTDFIMVAPFSNVK